jgi:hypothetical protein
MLKAEKPDDATAPQVPAKGRRVSNASRAIDSMASLNGWLPSHIHFGRGDAGSEYGDQLSALGDCRDDQGRSAG